jgi:diadenosine tetraphosphate (Ap4A) HIT family hydrolase
MAEEKENKDMLYEDELGFALLSDATLGHIKVFPKKEVKKVQDLDDATLEHLFLIASYAATVVFETLGAEGTNIVAHSNKDSFYIDVLPRKMNDGLGIRAEPKAIPEAEVEDAKNRIKDKADYIGVEQKDAAPEQISKETKEQDESSYMVKHLDRSP